VKPVLHALHLLTRDGALNADAHRKLKQVRHFIGLLAPALEDLPGDALIIDAGAGKGYLGFMLEAVLQHKGKRAKIVGLETRQELVDSSNALAKSHGSDVRFERASIAAYLPPARPHLLIALHACDTATDDALALAIAHDTPHIAVVPCCQAEVAQLLKGHRNDSPLGELFAHPIHRREFGSHLTNVVRSLVLEALGYKVTATELVGFEHSFKNELILGARHQKSNPPAQRRLQALLDEFHVQPALVRALGETLAPRGPTTQPG
jgi:Methyltransferase domain